MRNEPGSWSTLSIASILFNLSFVYAILYAILKSTTYSYKSVHGEPNLNSP